MLPGILDAHVEAGECATDREKRQWDCAYELHGYSIWGNNIVRTDLGACGGGWRCGDVAMWRCGDVGGLYCGRAGIGPRQRY